MLPPPTNHGKENVMVGRRGKFRAEKNASERENEKEKVKEVDVCSGVHRVYVIVFCSLRHQTREHDACVACLPVLSNSSDGWWAYQTRAWNVFHACSSQEFHFQWMVDPPPPPNTPRITK